MEQSAIDAIIDTLSNMFDMLKLAKTDYKVIREVVSKKKAIKTFKERDEPYKVNLAEEIPDEAYLYLSLGSTFSSTVNPKKHDYVFDTKEFCRKLAWSAYHENQKKEGENKGEVDLAKLFESDEDEEQKQSWKFPQKLKLKSRRLTTTTTTKDFYKAPSTHSHQADWSSPNPKRYCKISKS